MSARATPDLLTRDICGRMSLAAIVLLFGALFICLCPSSAWATDPPISVSPPAIEGEATVDSPMEGDKGDWEGAAPLSFDWQWLRCDAEGAECGAIPGAIEPNRSVKELDLGSTLRLKVTASNAAGSASGTSAATAAITEPEAPVNSAAPYLEGQMNVGEIVTVDVGIWSHHPSAFEFQWRLCDAKGENCEDIEGATDERLLLPPEAEGGSVRVSVTALNRGGETSAETAAGSLVDPMTAPENEFRPRLGFPEETKLLGADVGDWAGGLPMTFDYQWYRCNAGGEECAEIPGATGEGYTPTSEDVENRLKVKVTATNAAGSASEYSDPSAAVSESVPWFSGDVVIKGEPVEGGELSVDTAALHGSDPKELDYQWLRCFEDCDPIPSATSATYIPGVEDVAHRLRVEVTARNGYSSEFESDSDSRSRYSAPVEPAETEGPPRLADFPQLEGMPRTGETLTATSGVWRGTGEVLTSVRWQRCTGGAETCEDIEAATASSYEVGAEDTGNRIRAVVTASSEEGSGEAGSRLTAPIIPEVDTLWILEGGLSVEEVLEAAQESEAPVVSIEYEEEEFTGAYSGGIAGTKAEDVLEAIAETGDPETLIVKRLAVSGDFAEGEGEGGEQRRLWNPLKTLLEAFTKSQRNTPSIRPSNDPQPTPEAEPPPFPPPGPLPNPGFDEPTEPSIGEPGLSLPIINFGELVGYGWECLGVMCEEPGGPPHWSPAPREVSTEFRWSIGLEDLLTEMYEQGMEFAFEFDVKLYNPHNSEGGLTGISCPDSESDDFWITDRDDMRWESYIPEDAGAYWDTDLLDPCNRKDITFGVYHPEKLAKGRSYRTNFYFNKAGNSPRSGIEWHAEMLERRGGCDDSPWCVNVEPFWDDYRLPQVIIPRSYRWDFPRCYAYHYIEGLRGADECTFPV